MSSRKSKSKRGAPAKTATPTRKPPQIRNWQSGIPIIFVLISYMVFLKGDGFAVAISFVLSVATYAWIISKTRKKEQVLEKNILLLLQQKKLDKLINLYQDSKWIRIFSAPQFKSKVQAQIYYYLEDYQVACSLYEQCVPRATPRQWAGLALNLAHCHFHLKHFEKAELHYRAILKRRPEFSGAKANLARCLIHLNKNKEDARAYLLEAQTLTTQASELEAIKNDLRNLS